MQESIERSAVFGETERGKSFDVADDGFSHIASIEQRSIGQGQGQSFHVLTHFGQQHQASFEHGRRALPFLSKQASLFGKNALQKSSTVQKVSISRPNVLTSHDMVGSAQFLE